MSLWKRSDAGEAAIALLSPTSMLEEKLHALHDVIGDGSTRVGVAVHPCALRKRAAEPLTYDANSVGKPNSGARPGTVAPTAGNGPVSGRRW